MEEWGLGAKAGAAFGTLSGGQRQRLLVALALVNGPQVVFLDEMTTGLDPAARRATWDLIEPIRDAGTTVVLVSHFMDEAARLFDRLAVVDKGRVIASGTPLGLVAERQDGVIVRFGGPGRDVDFLRGVEGVRDVKTVVGRVEVVGEPGIVARVGKALVEAGVVPDDMAVVRPSLEDVYLGLVSGEGS
jgi:ABC-2 type transport system ATP-binding protein